MADSAAPGISNPFLTLWDKVMTFDEAAQKSLHWLVVSLEMAESLTAGDGFSDLDLGFEDPVQLRWQHWDNSIALIDHLFRVTGLENTSARQTQYIPHDGGDRSQYEELMWRVCDQRRIVWLDNDTYSLGPACVRVGDHVMLLAGG